MNFPIPVDLTVAQNNVPVIVTVSDNSSNIGLGIETEIVASVVSEYEGPYSVTPSESVQTLETDDKAMTDDVTVGAIPSDYVGSAIPRNTSADLTASGQTVTAPAGYYLEAASKSVQSGSVSVPYTGRQVTPTITVSNRTGTVYATVEDTFDVAPTVSEGYVTSGTQGTVRILGVGFYDLSTQAAKTITPTETEQIAVAAQKFTTGEVKVAPIPSNYGKITYNGSIIIVS